MPDVIRTSDLMLETLDSFLGTLEPHATFHDARAIAAAWKDDYNHRRPHSSLGYQTPAGFAAACAACASAKASAPAAHAGSLGQPCSKTLISPGTGNPSRSTGLDAALIRGHTFGMKTAVSIPDDVFEDAERLASRLHTSRSKLYARALAEFVARHDDDRVTALMDEAVREAGGQGDAFVAAAAQQSVQRAEW